MTPIAIRGDCVSCRRADVWLYKWKIVAFGERWRTWLCQDCRNAPRQEVTRRIEFNLTHQPILPREALLLQDWLPTEADRAESRAVAGAARAVLEALDRAEASDGDD
jgi:hypothetical protein